MEVQSNQFPRAKRPRIEVWGLWDETNKRWEGGASDPVKGSWEKCAGIKKKIKSQFIKHKIVPYDPNRK